MNFRSYLIALLLIAWPALAAHPEPVLVAKPGLCIIQDPSMTDCVMALDLSWSASEAAPYCLYQSQNLQPLQCWQSARQGKHHVELSSQEDVDYWLQHDQAPAHLAQITIRVVSLAQRNPERRRRRHVWSIL